MERNAYVPSTAPKENFSIGSKSGAVAATDVDPAISPDGRDMVFTSNRTKDNDIYLLNNVGAEPVNLTDNPANDGWARWSPDGSRIVFHSNRDGNFEIYIMNVATRWKDRLTDYKGIDQFPDWSPDGNSILFRRDLVSMRWI